VSAHTRRLRRSIVAAAAQLFTTHGYAATSTRMIAEAVGLRQSSLYYYFPSKEAVLSRLLQSAWRPGLAYAAHLLAEPAPPDARLFALLTYDLESLLALPWSLGALYYLPDARGQHFAELWRERDALHDVYVRLVRQACADGSFLAPDPDAAADLVFRLTESVAVAHGPRADGAPVDFTLATTRSCLALLRAADPDATERSGQSLRTRLEPHEHPWYEA
jgi:AcrR family transcriptional regulator